MEYVTISKWCQNWLREEYHTEAVYLPNGIDPSFYPKRGRDLQGKIRILIEGDCSAEHKNVDESFRIVEQLDLEKFEIWYMSYNGNLKSWYRVDRFLHRVPYEKTPEVYAACDILLKTSLLESFSYPPLEMMASGGYVVAVPNGGNLEYLKDGEVVKFGHSELKVIHVPGHSPGGLCFYSDKDKLLVAGDVLFQGSIGRADLPGGDMNQLLNGIREKLFVLPDDVRVIPGHGGFTTIGEEKRMNPFFQ